MSGTTDAHLARSTILLQGATGALGGALLTRLLDGGTRLGIPVRKDWQARRLQERLPAERCLVGVVGTGDGEAAAGFVKGVADTFGGVDAMLSAAGAFGMAEVGSDRVGDAAMLIEANLLSVVTLCRAAVASMRRRGTGALVFTGAAIVGTPTPGMAMYAASKAALHEFATTLARERPELRVAVVAPSILDTPANRAAMPDADRSAWLPLERVAEAIVDAAFGAPGPVIRPLTGGRP